MVTHYNVKETALRFASFEANTEAVTWFSGSAVVKSTFVESKTSPSPKRFESESSPSPKRFESESSPSPKRFESESSPSPKRFESGSSPSPKRFESKSKSKSK